MTFWMFGTAGDLSFTSSLTSTCPAATSRRELKRVKCSYTGFATPQRTAVVYIRITDREGAVHVSLVMSKTRVAPLKKLTIPRLELCGAHLLSQILPFVQETLSLPRCEIHAWTDSTVVLSWLAGDPRWFKTYVGNRVSRIVESVPSKKWRHVSASASHLAIRVHFHWLSSPRSLVLYCPKSQFPGRDRCSAL